MTSLLFYFQLPLEVLIHVGKKGGKLQKTNISRTAGGFLGEINIIFHNSLSASFSVKYKK